VFYVQNGSISERVCKTAFLSIFGISNGRLSRALQAQASNGGLPHMDQRGRHEPVNKTPSEKLQLVKEHIESFPAYESHYSRKNNPRRKYLAPMLSISKMYQLFKERGAKNQLVNESIEKFSTRFNGKHSHAF
jgi:hypothetical protein